MDIVPDIKKDNLSKQQIEVLAEQEKHYKKIGSMKVVPGHIMFCYNTVTNQISRAKYMTECSMDFRGNPVYKKKLVVDPNCFYEQALNKKNFIKRLKRYGYVEEIKAEKD